jgi:hypothetical protein
VAKSLGTDGPAALSRDGSAAARRGRGEVAETLAGRRLPLFFILAETILVTDRLVFDLSIVAGFPIAESRVGQLLDPTQFSQSLLQRFLLLAFGARKLLSPGNWSGL